MESRASRRRIGSPPRSASEQVIEATAAIEGCNPVELPQLLYDVVDPDALNRLARSDGIEIEFSFNGYDVRVRGAIDITVSHPDTCEG